MRLSRVLVPALALAGLLTVIAVGCGDDDEPSAAEPPRTAESDARAAASDEPAGAQDIALATGGSCSAPWTPAGDPPEGVTIDGWANATFSAADDEARVIAALAGEIGVPQAAIECFFIEEPFGEEEPPSPGGAEAADRAAASAGASAESGAGDASEPIGAGWCGVDWEPDATLPDGASITLAANASFGPKALLEPARAALARASGQPAARIDCNHEIPPVGECFVELGAPAGALPEGAQVEGNVFGTYIRPGDEAPVKAAVAALAGVDEGKVRCTDLPDGPIPIDEPVSSSTEGSAGTDGE